MARVVATDAAARDLRDLIRNHRLPANYRFYPDRDLVAILAIVDGRTVRRQRRIADRAWS
jgi:hypothetical protein